MSIQELLKIYIPKNTNKSNDSQKSLITTGIYSDSFSLYEAIKAYVDENGSGGGSYTHPNHTGDVTSLGDGITTIANGAVTTLKLANNIDVIKLSSGVVSNTEFDYLNNLTGPIQSQLDIRQLSILFQDEGVSLGTAGTVNTLDFTGTGITTSRSGDKITVNVSAGATNLTYAPLSGSGIVISSTGTDATIPARTGSFAGLMLPSDMTTLTDLVTLTGIPANSVNLGTFSGSIIPDGVSIKDALQALETATSGATSINGITGTGLPGAPIKLGNSLSESTTIDGIATYQFNLLNLTGFTAEAESSGGSARSLVNLQPNAVNGALLRSEMIADTTINAELRLDPDGALTKLRQSSGANYSTLNLQSAGTLEMEVVASGVSKTVGIDSTRHYMENVNAATASQVLYIDNSTGTVTRGDLPSSGLTRAQVAPTGGHTGKVTCVFSGAAPPTFVKTSASIWTITVPSGTDLLSMNVYSPIADNPGSNLTLVINTSSAVLNQDITTMHIPIITGVALGAFPGNYAPTTGATNLLPFVQAAPSSGDITLLLNNFNSSSSLGTGATLLKLVW